MMVKHKPLFDTKKVEKFFSEKDGVPVKYVCTSATNSSATFCADVFYRETPHPEFGNHYFGLYLNPYHGDARVMITNADMIEDFEFGMVEDSLGDLHYSAHRHDYQVTDNGNMIDGGRAYIRTSTGCRIFKVKDGEFVEIDHDLAG